MAIVDFIVIAIAIISAITGAKKGFFSQLGSLLGIVVGVYLAYQFSDQVGEWIGVDDINPIFAYALLFLVGAVAALLLASLASKILHGIGLGFFDYVGGALLSLVTSVLVMSLLLGFVRQVGESMDADLLKDSVTVPIIEEVSDVVFPYLVEIKDAVIDGSKDVNLEWPLQ